MNWLVHKFGGTSVANAERYQNVAQLMRTEKNHRMAVVVSAMSKVTDALIEVTELAKQQSPLYLEKLEALKVRHQETTARLLPSERRGDLLQVLDHDFDNLKEVLRGVWHVRSCSERTVELVSGHGELWSAQFLHAYFLSCGVAAKWLDARQILVVEPGETAVNVLWEESQKKIDQWLSQNQDVNFVVVTGFVAATRDGIATTLRRNGSDYSASIFGALLKAKAISIWKGF